MMLCSKYDGLENINHAHYAYVKFIVKYKLSLEIVNVIYEKGFVSQNKIWIRYLII